MIKAFRPSTIEEYIKAFFFIIISPSVGLTILFESKKAIIFTVLLLLAPIFVPFLTYTMLIGLVFIILFMLFFEFVYQRLPIPFLSRDTIHDFPLALLVAIFSPFNWIAVIGLYLIANHLPLLFVWLILCLVLRIAWEIHSHWYDLMRYVTYFVNRIIHPNYHKTCHLCQQVCGENNLKEYTEPKEFTLYYICFPCKGDSSPYLTKELNTYSEVMDYIDYRKDNLAMPFYPDYEIELPNWQQDYVNGIAEPGADPHIVFDTVNGTFKITENNVSVNTDIFFLEDVTSCKLDIYQVPYPPIIKLTQADYRDAQEDRIADKKVQEAILKVCESQFNGMMPEAEPEPKPTYMNPNPKPTKKPVPVYEKDYFNFILRIELDHPYVSKIDVNLNDNPIFLNEGLAIRQEYEDIGNELVAFFTKYGQVAKS